MTILKTLKAQLSNGIPSTFDQLAEALAVALEELAVVRQERNQFEAITRDMGGWLSECVVAHLKKDAAGVKAVLDAFVAKNVKVVDHTNPSGSMH